MFPAFFMSLFLAEGALPILTGTSYAAEIQMTSRVIKVGPDDRVKTPSKAAEIANDRDIIEIAAGTYEGDVAVWTQNDLTIRGVGGRARMIAKGAAAEGKAIWVIKGNATVVENIEFLGARVPDGNGAGIRQEGAGLTVRNCYFGNNENGVLAGANAQSDILIEFSEFDHNGNGQGNTHNIYIGTVRSFTLRYSYVHHAKVGHNVKSRSLTNHILYNRIMDERSGTASYQIDIPNGGSVYIIGNLLQKGPNAENSNLLSYAAEGMSNPGSELFVVNNTFVNDRPQGGQFLNLKAQPRVVKVVNNIFAGRGTVLQGGTGELSHNLTSIDPGLKHMTLFDYRLTFGSAAIDAGIDPGTSGG
jgi:hypothetical protein